MLHIATFNIFWYPESGVAQNARSDRDEGRIGHVIRTLAPHVIAFQEILDLERLQQLLGNVGSSLRLKSPDGDWLASGNVDSTNTMKIACAYDEAVLELVHHAKLDDPVPDRRFSGRRYPYALHLRHRDTGWEFTFVGVHCKSGLPVGSDPPNDEKRLDEVTHLSTWLSGEADLKVDHFEGPPTADVLVIGDFNAVWGHASLAGLRAGTPEAWRRPEPVGVTSFAGEEPGLSVDLSGERWSTYLDRVVIDHVFATPQLAARFSGPPCIYAFDLDPGTDDYPSPAGHWLRRATSYRAKPYGGASRQVVANLYRISDHRPLRVSLDPG